MLQSFSQKEEFTLLHSKTPNNNESIPLLKGVRGMSGYALKPIFEGGIALVMLQNFS
jgi:hypothetical protein